MARRAHCEQCNWKSDVGDQNYANRAAAQHQRLHESVVSWALSAPSGLLSQDQKELLHQILSRPLVTR